MEAVVLSVLTAAPLGPPAPQCRRSKPLCEERGGFSTLAKPPRRNSRVREPFMRVDNLEKALENSPPSTAAPSWCQREPDGKIESSGSWMARRRYCATKCWKHAMSRGGCYQDEWDPGRFLLGGIMDCTSVSD
jgi:hypothetical protein